MGSMPVISGKDLLRVLLRAGFELLRVNGSHHRLRHPDGRVTTIPEHGSKDLPKGLLRKIIREDLKVEVDDLVALIEDRS